MHDDLLRRFVANRGELLGYLTSLLPGHLIDDAFQEVFLVVVKRADHFDRTRDFDAWVRGIARNVARRVRDAHAAHAPLPDDIADLVETAYHEAEDPARDDLRRLRVCLDQVGEAQRELLRRRYHEGLSMAELAAATGRTAGAVQVALSRLRASLFECIERARRRPA